MKIFVAGATGVLGRRAVARLVAAGHSVTAVARTPAKAALVRSLGATPVTVDLFDERALRAAVAGHDVVCNLATNIPAVSRMALPGAWEMNNRIRREASRNLVDAALAGGASRYIQESIAFMYPDRGDEWIDEDVPLDLPADTATVADAEASAHRFTASGGTGVVLRFGMFYAADSDQTASFVKSARNGVSLLVGRPHAYASMIHVDDAAAAVVAAMRAPAGVYNVVDEPLTRTDNNAALAAALGRRALRALPAAGVALGGSTTRAVMRSQRVSNRRFRDATGWQPVYRSVREGWPQVVAEIEPRDTPAAPVLVRVALALLGVGSVVVGLWAQVAPRSWYVSFPASGRHWVSADGPYNQHLIRDVGGLNLALGLLTVVAIVIATRPWVRAAAAAWLVYSVPHLAYHASHLNPFGTGDAVANVVALSVNVVVPIFVLVAAARHPGVTPSHARGALDLAAGPVPVESAAGGAAV